MAVGEVRISGLKELNKALRYVEKNEAKTIRDAIKVAGEPVRLRAEALASSKIRNIGSTWPRMRIGSTSRTVYVAPKARRKGGSPRANLGRLLFERAMMPALEDKQHEVVREVERALEKLGNRAGF